MNIFIEYIQPLTDWLQVHPYWALFFTFLIAATESIAIIGSIIPGSLTMTAIGILAGSGILRIDLTLLSAALGAIAGDSLSYFLGYYYSNRLYGMWPFKKYPALLIYGTKFFEQHGGKSVLIGRFIGPLRSIIPVIAGIVRMKQWRFLVANFISAIGWAILYVVPGILIGAASQELTPESATRLFIIILLAIALIWISSQIIKWILIRMQQLLIDVTENTWNSFQSIPFLSRLYRFLTPEYEANHFKTGALVFSGLFNYLCFVTLTLLIIFFPDSIASIDSPIHYLLNSFHTSIWMQFFVVIRQFTSKATLVVMLTIVGIHWIYQKNYKSILYTTLLMLASLGLASLLTSYIISPRPGGLRTIMGGNSFPDVNLLLATSLYCYLMLHQNLKSSTLMNALRTVLMTILWLSGLGALYLGDQWLTDVIGSYTAGIFLAITFFLLYRRKYQPQYNLELSVFVINLILILLFISSMIAAFISYKKLVAHHQLFTNELVLQERDWWNQKEHFLPIYRYNRLGDTVSLMNIQYQGSLSALKNKLLKHGWQLQPNSFFKNLLKKINNQKDSVKMPLLAHLYLNRPPVLIMTFQAPQANLSLILRIWKSNYDLVGTEQPLWVGSIDVNIDKNSRYLQQTKTQINGLSYLLPALDRFIVRRILLSEHYVQSKRFPQTPFILLIKEPVPDELSE